MVRRRLLETDEAIGEWSVAERTSDDYNKLSYQIWKVSAGSSTCSDGAIAGVMAPPLMEAEVLLAHHEVLIISAASVVRVTTTAHLC